MSSIKISNAGLSSATAADHAETTQAGLVYNQAWETEVPPPICRKKRRLAQRCAKALFDNPAGRHTVPINVEQHANPPTLAGDAKSTFGFVEPSTAGVKHIATGKVVVSSGKEWIRGFNKLHMEVSETSSRLYILVGGSRHADSLAERFDHYRLNKANKKEVTALDVYVTELHPKDLGQAWFPQLALALVKLRVKATVHKSTERAAHPRHPHHHINISALTAVAITMKIFGDVRAFAKVVSYAPEIIARDFRVFSMGQTIGTQATRVLIASIFEELKINNYKLDQTPLIGAIADILVAHMSRHYRHVLLRTGNKEVSERKLRVLVDVGDKNVEDLDVYARMATLRDGIIYGAMRCYVMDTDEHNDAHLAVLTAVASGAADTASAAAGASPAGPIGSASVKSLSNVLAAPFKFMFGRRYKKGARETGITNHFECAIKGSASQGYIPKFGRLLTNKDDIAIAELYSVNAERVSNELKGREPPLTLAVYTRD